MNTDIVYRYIGNGAFVVADVPVPARDIAEWEVMLSPELKAAIETNIANAPGSCFERVEVVAVAAPVTTTKAKASATVTVTPSSSSSLSLSPSLSQSS
jgi:hypothetical protein